MTEPSLDGPDLSVLAVPERIEVVERLVARGADEQRLERLAEAAARVLRAAGAAVSLVAADVQLTAAAVGEVLPDLARQVPIEDSLCARAAASGEPLVVSDATRHPWVRSLPAVTSGGLRAYLGVPLVHSAGHVLGALCVTGSESREWTPEQVEDLVTLAGLASTELEHQAAEEPGSAVRMQLAVEAADLGSYEYDLRTGEVSWDDRMLALHGYVRETFPGSFEAFRSVVHPDDRVRVEEAMAHAVAVLGDLLVDYRVVLPGGDERWIKARGRVLPDMLGTAARILGAAYDSSADRELRDELTRLLETMPAAFLRLSADWTITYVNAHGEELYGRSRHELVGRDFWDAFPDAVGTELEESYREALRSGQRRMVEDHFEALDKHFEVHSWPDEQGLSVFFHDVSDRRRAHAALAQANQRLAVLVRAGDRLSASLQPRECLAVLADLIVPDLADWLVLVVPDDVADLLGVRGSGGDSTRLHPVHLVHVDPERQRLLEEVATAQVLRTSAPNGVGRAVRTEQPEALPAVPEEVMAARAATPEDLDRMRALNSGPVLSVPLRAAGAVVGGFTVGTGQDRQLDQALLVDLATRAAAALDNALTYARERREATVLQSALLPREAALVEGVQLATRYLPARAEALAGGDFFKTVRVGSRMVLMLGDVMGHGTASAARAGQLHGLGAALALEGHQPGALLERLAAGVEQMMDLQLATLVVCSYDPATLTLTTASAGHPPPLLAPVGGRPHYVDLEAGPPIGVVAGASYPEVSVPLERGTTVVLFSDGLVEQRGESITVGLERLRAALDEVRLPPEAVADHVLQECARSSGGDDDVALLVLSHVP